MQKGKFEKSLKEVFNGAEQDPSDSVWTNIDLELERMEGGKMKRRVLFYQLVAAASIAFAMTAVGLLYYSSFNSTNTSDALAVKTDVRDFTLNANDHSKDNRIHDLQVASEMDAASEDQHLDQATTLNMDKANVNAAIAGASNTLPADQLDRRSVVDDSAQSISKRSRNTRAMVEATKHNSNANGVVDPSTKNFNEQNSHMVGNDIRAKRKKKHEQNFIANQTTTDDTYSTTSNNLTRGNSTPSLTKPLVLVGGESNQRLPSLYVDAPVVFQMTDNTPDPGMLLLAQLADEEKKLNEENTNKDKHDERLWTSVGFAAGSYTNASKTSPPVQQVSAFASIPQSDNSALANRSIANETNASGTTYSIGLNVGGKVAKRWVLQGGVNYLTQSSSYTSNVFLKNENQVVPTSLTTLNKAGDAGSRTSNLIGASDYSVNNSMQFFSVPVMAGYLIIDRSFGWQLNTGVSTDLFLQNEVSSESNNLGSTMNGRGSDSPYRPYNFSGLVGTEFSYRVANRYRVALNPGIRYPFNSIYKSETGIEATPITFDVALKFRYIFQ